MLFDPDGRPTNTQRKVTSDFFYFFSISDMFEGKREA